MQQVCDLGSPSGPRVKVLQQLYSSIDEAIADLFDQCVVELSLEHISSDLRSLEHDKCQSTTRPEAELLVRTDAALDQTAFLLQAVERYLRLVSSFVLAGHVGKPSSVPGKLSEAAQALMGQFVHCEQAFVAQQMASTLNSSIPVELQAGVFVDGWVDTAFYILRQSVSRCASTYSKMTAAASLNHIVGLFEDHLQPAFKLLLQLCSMSADEVIPELAWVHQEPQLPAEASLAAAVNNKDGSEKSHDDGPSESYSVHAVRSMNSSALVVVFTRQLAQVVSNELGEIFATQETPEQNSSGDTHAQLDPLLTLGIHQLSEAAEACDALWRGCLRRLVQERLHSQLGIFMHAMRSSSFNIPSEYYDSVLAKHGLFKLFEDSVLAESGLEVMVGHLSADAKDAFGRALSVLLNDALFEFALGVKCNELGGMYLNRLVADVRAALQARGIGKGVRSTFSRTLQSIAILCSSSVSEACQLLFPLPTLTASQVRQLLHHRLDFLAPDVEHAELGGLNLLT